MFMHDRFYASMLIAGGGQCAGSDSKGVTKMYIEIDGIITLGKVLSALGIIFGGGWTLFCFIHHQKEQDKTIDEFKADVDQRFAQFKKKYDGEIQSIKDTQSENQKEIQEEQQLIVYGLLACLKGLQSQGAGDSVTAAIEKIEKHINRKAHE